MKYDKLADKINRKAWEKTKKDLSDDKMVEEVLNKTGLGLGITALIEGGRINIDLDKFKQAIELAIEAGRQASQSKWNCPHCNKPYNIHHAGIHTWECSTCGHKEWYPMRMNDKDQKKGVKA